MSADARQQFAARIEQHKGIVLKVAHAYCRHPDDRADLAQEIAAQAWRAFPRYDPARSFSTWMYRIALNVAISQLRSNSGRHRHWVPLDEQLHDVAAAGVDHEADERVLALHRVMAQLEPLNRALLVLYLEDHSYRQIGEILGISETNVATKISRLKQRIRNEISG